MLESYVLANLYPDANELSKVPLFNMGLGESLGSTRIDVGGKDGRHRGGASKIAADGRIVPTISLDHFRIPDLSIIQLDVEGYELPVLSAASETFDRDAGQVRRELERFMQASTKTESKLTTAEANYKSKAQQVEAGAAASQTPSMSATHSRAQSRLP